MRTKDNQKQAAIVAAIVQKINEIGFVNVSMSKVAKAAGVSTSTLYIYYQNKEDMFQQVYGQIKGQMITDSAIGLELQEPIRQSVQKFCANILKFQQDHEDYFLFLEQASNSPLLSPLSATDFGTPGNLIYAVFQKGIDDSLLRNVSVNLILGFCVYPISQIYKENSVTKAQLAAIDFDQVFEMCWNAIRA